MDNKTILQKKLLSVGFAKNYIRRAIKVYERNYGYDYNFEVIVEILVRLQNRDKIKKWNKSRINENNAEFKEELPIKNKKKIKNKNKHPKYQQFNSLSSPAKDIEYADNKKVEHAFIPMQKSIEYCSNNYNSASSLAQNINYNDLPELPPLIDSNSYEAVAQPMQVHSKADSEYSVVPLVDTSHDASSKPLVDISHDASSKPLQYCTADDESQYSALPYEPVSKLYVDDEEYSAIPNLLITNSYKNERLEVIEDSNGFKFTSEQKLSVGNLEFKHFYDRYMKCLPVKQRDLYYEKFVKLGYNDIEIMLFLNGKNLREEIGMNAIHVRIFMDKINVFKNLKEYFNKWIIEVLRMEHCLSVFSDQRIVTFDIFYRRIDSLEKMLLLIGAGNEKDGKEIWERLPRNGCTKMLSYIEGESMGENEVQIEGKQLSMEDLYENRSGSIGTTGAGNEEEKVQQNDTGNSCCLIA